MRRALLTAALVLALPATALAAPFGELPFRPVSGAAACLQPTGAPGELTRWVTGGAEVLQARPDGLVPVATVALGKVSDCPAAAADASGAGVLAAGVPGGIRIALREPGGAWGTPVTIAAYEPSNVEVAISARGDAVAAWQEGESRPHTTAHAVSRAAGAGFGAPQLLGTIDRYGGVDVAIGGDGEALVTIDDRAALRITNARPGGPFGAPRQLLGHDSFSGDQELAAGPDGRVLLAVMTEDGIVVFEREPGTDFVRRPAIAADSMDDVALALGPHGTAVVAWQSGGPGGQVLAAMRDGGSAFGAPVLVRRDETLPNLPGPLTSFGWALFRDAPPFEGGTRLRAALDSDGGALLAWGTQRLGTRVATVTLAGRVESGWLGSTVRDPAGVTPLLSSGGMRAVAWSDGNGISSSPPYAGRLHLAIEGAVEASAPAPPTLAVGTPRDRSLRPSQPLVLPLSCSAACDIHASIAGEDPDSIVSLPRAGTTFVRFKPVFHALAPLNGAPVAVELRWSAPGARRAAQRTARVRLQRLPAPPFPRIEGLRVRRRTGGRVAVSWNTDIAARDAYFSVMGTATRSQQDLLAIRTVNGGGRRRFHATLAVAAKVRYVHVVAGQVAGRRSATAVVKVP